MSRWEWGITFPNPHFRQELCTLFGKSPEKLGLLQDETTESHESFPPHVPPDQGVVSSSPQTARIAEERRLVTLLFADVMESTALGGTLDPEDVRALDGPLLTRMHVASLPTMEAPWRSSLAMP